MWKLIAGLMCLWFATLGVATLGAQDVDVDDGVIVIEGSLAFLGLSVALPTPSWGNLISEGATNGNLQVNPLIMLWPALAMFLLLLSINLIGDRLRQKFDIREGLL